MFPRRPGWLCPSVAEGSLARSYSCWRFPGSTESFVQPRRPGLCSALLCWVGSPGQCRQWTEQRGSGGVSSLHTDPEKAMPAFVGRETKVDETPSN